MCSLVISPAHVTFSKNIILTEVLTYNVLLLIHCMHAYNTNTVSGFQMVERQYLFQATCTIITETL